MKKLFNLALVGTMVLAAAACQREQVGSSSLEANENGVKEVTTQFVLNVTSAPQTKMTADVVQMKQNFRGMDNAKLYVYNTGMIPEKPESTTPDAFVLKTSSWTEDKAKYFDMGTLLSPSSLDNESTNNNDNSSNRVLQLSVPVGVDAVLFYGKAIKGNNAESYQYGGTNMTATKFNVNPAETVIAAQKILATDDIVESYDATGALMIYIINDILSTSVEKTTLSLYGFPGSTYPVEHVDPETSAVTITYDGAGHRDLSWDALGHQYEIQTKGASSRYKVAEGFGMGRTISGLEEVLGRCYFLFTDIRDGEYRTGSSGAVKKMVSDMYKVISDASQATPTNEYEANAKRLAVAILKEAEDFFFSPTATNIPEGYSAGDYRPLSTIQSEIGTAKWTSLNFNLAENLNEYPYEKFRIPRGAAQLGFGMEKQAKIEQGEETVGTEYLDGSGHYIHDFFYYLHPNKALVSHGDRMFEPRKYLHPAELWYYVNSPIRTTNKENLKVGDYPNGVNTWKNENSWDAWEAKGKVKSSTRGVAVKNNINYGVALLKSSVLKSADTYKDNRKAMTDNKENDRIIAKNDLKLTLTGILVGGVNPRMDWQFVRKYSSGDLSNFDGVIYDSSIANGTVPTPAGEENYTLVYDNFNSTDQASDGDLQNDQNKVLIALEFKNLGDPFWGKHNLIPTDGYFYLVAEVPAPTPAQIEGLASKWPTDHQIPPLYGVDGEAITVTGKVAGESKKIARVFMQDFMTEIKFNLVENSLKNAYYTMPDLRASQMSLGLSVDLQWIPGLQYNDINL